jgi:hypothetical protein
MGQEIERKSGILAASIDAEFKMGKGNEESNGRGSRSTKPYKGRADRSVSPNGKEGEILHPPLPPPRQSGRVTTYTRESPPLPAVTVASVPMRKQSSTGRGIAPPSNEVIAVDCLPYLK